MGDGEEAETAIGGSLPPFNGCLDSPGDQHNEPFEIPELPRGKLLQFILYNNWGDAGRVGLEGIQVFLEDGTLASFQSISSNAERSIGEICTLVEYGRSEEKKWIAEFSSQSPPVSIDLLLISDQLRIALIRVSNYAGSRVHSQMGVRELEIRLDGIAIFRGIITPAISSSDSAHTHHQGDTILFTTVDSILESIAANDVCMLEGRASSEFFLDSQSTNTQETIHITPKRPITAEEMKGLKKEEQKEREERMERECKEKTHNLSLHSHPSSQLLYSVRVVHLELLSNWGCPDQIGLTGVEFFDDDGFTIDMSQVTVTTSHAPELAARLTKGSNVTSNPEEMWITSFDSKEPHPTILFSFNSSVDVCGISVWNYNGGEELSYAGVKHVTLHCDGKLLAKNFLLRKAPGCVFFDFVQDFSLSSIGNAPTSIPRSTSFSIAAFIFQLRLLSTWGDEFYIGLNGIQLFDRNNMRIPVKSHNLAAFPESLNILPQVEHDPRVSENLIRGEMDTNRSEHSWLTPLLPNLPARIFFIFDYPMSVSRILIFNYRKTPSRGVRHLSVSADDVIIFSGEVPCSEPASTATLDIQLGDTL